MNADVGGYDAWDGRGGRGAGVDGLGIAGCGYGIDGSSVDEGEARPAARAGVGL